MVYAKIVRKGGEEICLEEEIFGDLVSGNGDILAIPIVVLDTLTLAGGEEVILILSADGFPGFPGGGGAGFMGQ